MEDNQRKKKKQGTVLLIKLLVIVILLASLIGILVYFGRSTQSKTEKAIAEIEKPKENKSLLKRTNYRKLLLWAHSFNKNDTFLSRKSTPADKKKAQENVKWLNTVLKDGLAAYTTYVQQNPGKVLPAALLEGFFKGSIFRYILISSNDPKTLLTTAGLLVNDKFICSEAADRKLFDWLVQDKDEELQTMLHKMIAEAETCEMGKVGLGIRRVLVLTSCLLIWVPGPIMNLRVIGESTRTMLQVLKRYSVLFDTLFWERNAKKQCILEKDLKKKQALAKEIEETRQKQLKFLGEVVIANSDVSVLRDLGALLQDALYGVGVTIFEYYTSLMSDTTIARGGIFGTKNEFFYRVFFKPVGIYFSTSVVGEWLNGSHQISVRYKQAENQATPTPAIVADQLTKLLPITEKSAQIFEKATAYLLCAADLLLGVECRPWVLEELKANYIAMLSIQLGEFPFIMQLGPDTYLSPTIMQNELYDLCAQEVFHEDIVRAGRTGFSFRFWENRSEEAEKKAIANLKKTRSAGMVKIKEQVNKSGTQMVQILEDNNRSMAVIDAGLARSIQAAKDKEGKKANAG
ncbi:hypothetical protein NEHOM01_0926 [Nematocida homosporus]|uniref:uncharacterized protein n=1 Tax=Nematocida homosporus TaxID=1912981 RepID=UPI00221FEF78|nr:uncharacterized protein NEHOM01_0926 [Nematocida homosporus]KAI5185600.1 hypothetical protein NEHOM01_0926 [Nematocida homosporus]